MFGDKAFVQFVAPARHLPFIYKYKYSAAWFMSMAAVMETAMGRAVTKFGKAKLNIACIQMMQTERLKPW